MDINRIQSSSSSPLFKWKYDVFVSFRGEDTRNNFTDHLFGALQRKGFVTFRDDTKLRKGEQISTELLQAIEVSKILIVVFSENYASSTWCLEELAKIADCIEVPGQTVLPIFYDVSPSEVRKQTWDYGKAFADHQERFKENLGMVQKWREALTQVANLSGWDVRDKPQYAEIGKIVQKVACILAQKHLKLPHDIVGLDSRVEELEKLLALDSDDIGVVGICGMGGIGKTTLATAVYDRISNQYDASCFIDDMSKLYANYGPIGAQKQLLCQTLSEEENLHIWNLPKANNLIRTRLCQTKALIVLDNVDQVDQLDKLGMERDLLGKGSKVIIISRDEHILRSYQVDEVYMVQPLNDYNARQLFCKKAFKCNDVVRDYMELVCDVLSYANGHPLAIKVLGSFLFGRDVPAWRSALVRLKENPRKDIMDGLRISYDALESTEKEIFLDIACFFDGKNEAYVKEFLDFRGFFPQVGLRVLIDKSLITVEKRLIRMHKLLRELGRSIVREKSPKEPINWSRLWDYKDLQNILLENKEAENLEVIIVKNFSPDTTMRAHVDQKKK
ncbi:disease resistance protein RUN1-like [Lotus japonicus]|uniref:disease resistance protein RUN1-like n=1 Tax=Lotus japonicus TaxID=34305 RepID=UPI00258C25E5|nr:disease resistance protein RUN1-like [Lotus japonicus]XP_057422689.1 disease resistance protein RUN1-like [Lotus japonicus]